MEVFDIMSPRFNKQISAVTVFKFIGRRSPAPPASSPVALDHWGIFESIMKESGEEGSDHFPLALYAGSRHPSLALLACLACSPSPTKPWESLWREQDLCSMNYLPTIHGSFSNGLRQEVKNGMFLDVANCCWFAFVTSH